MTTLVKIPKLEKCLESEEGADTEAYRKILIVDPDMNSRRMIKEKLRAGLGRSRSYGASSGEEALSIIERTDIDCVILYECTTDFRGLELVRHLTDCDSLAPIPVVILGGQWSLEREQHALNAGASALIQCEVSDARLLCSTLAQVISQDRLMRVLDLQNQHIQALSDERARYINRTDELAHDVLTPLASIQEFVSLVLDEVAGPINEEQGKHLAYARGGCATIRTTIEALVVNQDLERILSGNA